MKKASIINWVSIFLLLSTGVLFAETTPPKEGGVLPEITLSVHDVQTHQNYLGITNNKKTFHIPEIKAEVVLIEIFSMYCPYCQKDAPVVNELYNKIAQNEKLKNKIKMLGIGAGNSPFEVDFFQKTYHVKFPLFPDGEFIIHKMLGEVRTPYFIGVKINKDGTHSVFYSKRGAIEDASKFLNIILSKAGF
jgi:thiol-disulfide isomerase/thioredoxin